MARDKTILLVDDEADVRYPLKRFLEDNGFTVLEAGSGEEAIGIAQQLAGPLDLLLTDVRMPGMNGAELARALLGTRPRLRLLFMSGYAQSVTLDSRVLRAEPSFIQKPFILSVMLRKIHAILSRPHDTGALNVEEGEAPPA